MWCPMGQEKLNDTANQINALYPRLHPPMYSPDTVACLSGAGHEGNAGIWAMSRPDFFTSSPWHQSTPSDATTINKILTKQSALTGPVRSSPSTSRTTLLPSLATARRATARASTSVTTASTSLSVSARTAPRGRPPLTTAGSPARTCLRSTRPSSVVPLS